MAVNHALHTPFKPTELDADELQSALVEHVAYVVADAAEAQALDLTGIDVPALILGTDVFEHDATDTTTVHDGTTCLVTDDGKRFKNDGTRVNGTVIYAVDDDDLTAPPGSPAIGDAYLLPAAPTGDWAAYGKHVAIYTQRGWVFVAPRSGMLAYVSDEDGYFRYNGTSWVSGFGSTSIADGDLNQQKLEQPFGGWVESETATPPGSIPAAGTHYIVGVSATGAWAGEDGNIARSNGTSWEFITAVEGMQAFNRDTDEVVSFKNGSWSAAIASGILIYQGTRDTAGSGGSTVAGTGTTAMHSLGSHAVSAASNRVLVSFFVTNLFAGAAATATIGLYVDSETTPRDSITTAYDNQARLSFALEFEFSPGDTVARDYFIKITLSAGTGWTWRASAATLKELSA